MKIKYFIIPVFLVLSLFAATQQWEYNRNSHPDGAEIFQIISDGKGGCATAWKDTNHVMTVVWLDKKGKVKYERDLHIFMMMGSGPVIDCSAKRLFFMSGIPAPMIVMVNNKGDEEIIGSLDGYLTPPIALPVPPQRLVDKKGFFAVNADTNSIYQSLIRYSHK